MDTLTVSAKNNPLDIYRAAAPRIWDIRHTQIALSFNWKERTANGQAWLTMRPYFYAQDTLTLDAKSMQIDSVCIMNGNNMRPVVFKYEDDLLKLKLDKQYKATDSLKLYIKYVAKPYEAVQGGSKAISDDRGLYFVNTDYSIPNKPVQIWTQGETESNSHWFPTVDKPNERSTFQIALTVPDSFVTLSNGAMIQSRKNGNMRTDTWNMDKPIQVYAAMFAIGKFSVIKDAWRGKEVNYYVENDYAPYARMMFNNTPEMIEHFSNITGVSYPWNKYDQVVVRDYISGAMENTTASLFGEFTNQTAREIADKNNEDVVSHELFHQWFGDYVTAESWSNVTVNESFANYGEYLWRKYKYGNDKADELALEDLNKYITASQYNDPPLVRFNYIDREDVFDRISYEKGGRILHYLHSMVGDSAFYKAMNIYLTKNALQPAEATNWRLAVEEATGQDWNWYFNQWYLRGGHPKLDVEYKYNDSARQLEVTVTQKQEGKAYTLPLKAAVIYGKEAKVSDWNLKDKKEVFTYPYQNGEKPVFVPDATHLLPGEIKDHKLPAQWLVQYRAMNDYISKNRVLYNTYKVDDSSTLQIFGLALNDQIVSIRKYALELLAVTNSTKWQEKWRSQVAYMAVNDGNNNVRAAAFNVLTAWKITGSKADMMAAVNDSSYNVAGAALAGVNSMDKDTAYALAKQLVHQKPQANLSKQVWNIIGAKANPADIGLFEARAPYVYGTKKFDFAYSLVAYLKEVKDNAAFEKGLKILSDLGITESIKAYRIGLLGNIFSLERSYNTQKTEEAQKRVALIKKQEQRAIDAETDPENKKSLQNMGN